MTLGLGLLYMDALCRRGVPAPVRLALTRLIKTRVVLRAIIKSIKAFINLVLELLFSNFTEFFNKLRVII